MKPAFLIRVFAAASVGVLSAVFVAHDREKWRALGREAFLAEQAHRFDVRIASQSSRSAIMAAVGGVLVIAVYEGVVAAITKLASLTRPQ